MTKSRFIKGTLINDSPEGSHATLDHLCRLDALENDKNRLDEWHDLFSNFKSFRSTRRVSTSERSGLSKKLGRTEGDDNEQSDPMDHFGRAPGCSGDAQSRSMSILLDTHQEGEPSSEVLRWRGRDDLQVIEQSIEHRSKKMFSWGLTSDRSVSKRTMYRGFSSRIHQRDGSSQEKENGIKHTDTRFSTPNEIAKTSSGTKRVSTFRRRTRSSKSHRKMRLTFLKKRGSICGDRKAMNEEAAPVTSEEDPSYDGRNEEDDEGVNSSHGQAVSHRSSDSEVARIDDVVAEAIADADPESKIEAQLAVTILGVVRAAWDIAGKKSLERHEKKKPSKLCFWRGKGDGIE